MQIRSIEIQNFHNISKKRYEFEEINYIFGSNGAGKSTILEAIQLCLLGYIPNTNKTNTAIMEHSTYSPLVVTLVLEGKEIVTVTRKYKRVKTKVETELVITPDYISVEEIVGNLELPILNFNEFLGLTANKQKDLLVSILPSFKETINTRAYLNKAYQECKDINNVIISYGQYAELKDFDEDITTAQSVHNVIEEVSQELKELKSIEDIKQLNKLLKEYQSANNAEEKRLEATSQSLIFYDDYDGEEDRDIIKSEIKEFTQRKENLIRYQSQKKFVDEQSKLLKSYDGLGKDIESDPTYIKYISDLDETRLQADAVNLDIKHKNESICKLSAKIETFQEILDSKCICPLIQPEYKCDKLENQVKVISKDLDNLVNEKEELVKLVADLETKNTKLSKVLSELDDKLSKLKSSYEERDKILESISQIEIVDEALTEEALQVKIDTLTDDLAKAAANEQYQNMLESIQKQKFQLEINSVFLKAIIKATGENGLQTELMQKPFESLESNMNKLLNKLNLESIGNAKFIVETAANSFKFGFDRDGKFIPFDMISSGEKCIFLLVFMTALISISNSQLDVVIIDDLFDHLDDRRFEAVINNISLIASNTQYIIAGVKEIDSSNSKINIIQVN